MVVRYGITLLLGALLAMILGVTSGFLSLDPSAPQERQLAATGALAYYDCYYDYDYNDCVWIDETYYSAPEWYAAEPETTHYDPYGYPVDTSDVWNYSYWDESADEPDDVWTTSGLEPTYTEEWDEWGVENEWVEVRVEDPWYVQSFPGVGSLFQQIIPGQSNISVRAPAPTLPPPRPSYAQPSCWISSQPSSVAYSRATTLQWSSFYASSASLSGVGTVPTSGSRVIQNITSDRTYTLEVRGQGGTSSCYTQVSVHPLTAKLPTCVISVYPSSISRGRSASLAWVTTNSSAAAISGIGSVGLTGGRYVSPSESSTYTLTAYNATGQSKSCSVRLTVR